MQGASLTGGEVLWVFNADTGQFSQALVKAEGDVKRTMSNADRETQRADKSFNNLAKGGLAVVAGAAIAVGAAITRNIGGAIRRLDTLENSGRIFQNLGFSAEGVSASMDTLDQSLRGLPTRLDDAVRGVQSLASSAQSIEAGTAIFTALNNAVLGLGGGTQEVESAVLAMSRAMDNGVLQGREWNMLITAGLGPALTTLSREMGMTTGELQSGLSDGTIALGDFLQSLLTANEKGIGSMASFEQQARDATAGIGTGWQNMGAAITRGIAQVLDAVGSQNISNAISSIGSAFETALGAIAAGLRFVNQYGQFIYPLVTAIGTMAAAFTFTASAVWLGTKALAAFRAMMTLVTKHPIIAFLSIIAGLIAGIATFAGLGGLEKSMDDASVSAGDLADRAVEVEEGLGGAGKQADNLAKKLKDIADQEARIRRNYRENLAELVQRTRESIKTLQGQLSDEERAYQSTYNKRLNDFNQSQLKERESHEKKTRQLQTQIDFLRRYDNESNRRKLSELQFALAKENNLYQKQTNLRKQEYDLEEEEQRLSYEKRRAETQKRLDDDTALLNKHREEVASVRNVILRDEIQKMKDARDANLASLEEQRKDAARKGGEIGRDFGSEYVKKLREELDKADTKKSGESAGKGWVDGFKKNLGNFFSVQLPNFWQGAKNTFSNIGQVGKDFWNNFRIGLRGMGIGWANGGYTGRGAKYEVAGAVHRGEYVFRKDQVNQSTGMPTQEALTNMLKSTAPSSSVSGGSSGDTIYNITVTANGFLENKTQQRNLADLVVTNIQQMNKAKGIA